MQKQIRPFFEYDGRNSEIREQLARHRKQLLSFYQAVFGTHYQRAKLLKSRLLPSSSLSENSGALDQVASPVPGTPESELLSTAFDVKAVEEYYNELLEDHLLQALGYNPNAWKHRGKSIPYSKILHLEDSQPQIDHLLRVMVLWHLYFRDERVRNLHKSLKPYIEKTDFPSLQALLSQDVKNYDYNTGNSIDSHFCCGIVMFGYDGNSPIIDDKLVYVQRKPIISAPRININPESIELYKEEINDSDFPTAMVVYLHEFHHFLQYLVQSVPTILASTVIFTEHDRRIKQSSGH